MRFSKLLATTIKEAPKDAVLPSHIYLIRGAFIYQVASGIYDFLPLGKRVLEKIKKIIRDELNNVGCQEVQLGFITPAGLWKKSGRYSKYGLELLRFNDRKENEFVLGPTHEEMIVELANKYINSYKQLPMNLYQINLKFRDEARPRFGLLRGREFIMKDGYSFHVDHEDMVREFNNMEETYRRVFKRIGLEFRVVEADSGAIGGEGSKEFMVLSNSGEDTIVICNRCEYAANIEAAKRGEPKAIPEAPEANLSKFFTPSVTTIDDLSKFFRVEPYYFVKCVAKKALFNDKKSEIVLFFLRGSDELQERKAANSIGANELIDVSDDELSKAGLSLGYIGPVSIEKNEKRKEKDDGPFYIAKRALIDLKMVFDKGLEGAKNLICGANEENYHFVGVNLDEIILSNLSDIAQVKEGDCCPICKDGVLGYKKGIEVGHIFQLGTKYSDPLNATFLNKEGKTVPFTMGTYGIGVSRLLAAIVEQNHDDKGAIWPRSVAPFEVVIVVGNVRDDAQYEVAQKLYEDLKNRGIDVLLDDRAERFGFKMNDFELIGFPYAVIVGKGVENNKVEIVNRRNLEKVEMDIYEVDNKLLELLQ